MSHPAAGIEYSAVVPIVAAAALYAQGTVAAWGRAGRGRGVSFAALGCFVGGIATLALALLGPMHRLGEEMFSAHMLQHTLLMNVAAPLLVLGAPLPTMLRALPPGMRRALVQAAHTRGWRTTWRWLTGAAVATAIQQAVLWAWHFPTPIAASLEDPWLHATMHASLLAAALLFWTMVLEPGTAARWRGIASLVVTAKVMGLVCLVMLLSDGVHYAAYGERALSWGLSAADDERAGWGLMMLTAGPAYFIAAAVLASRALFDRPPAAAAAAS